MKTISVKVDDEYFKKVEEIRKRRCYPRSQFLLDALDHYMLDIGEMEIKRTFKPKIKLPRQGGVL